MSWLASSAGAFAVVASAALVVQASGGAEARYAPGARLTDSAVITLRKGEQLTLLRNGRNVGIRGPARGRVTALARQSIERERRNRPAVPPPPPPPP